MRDEISAAEDIAAAGEPRAHEGVSPGAPQMTELEKIRHSTAHVLATAILRIWPEAQFAAGPPVENGFYYDLELDHRISPEDFERIEAEMRKVIRENQTFERVPVDRKQALDLAKEGALAALGPRS